MSKARLIAIAMALPAFLAACSITPAQSAPEPYQGLKSVADAADKTWNAAHVRFRTLVAGSQNPCDEAVKQALASAQSALNERTRAWKEFYKQRGIAEDEKRKAAEDIEGKMDEELRATQANINSSMTMLDALKKKRSGLDAGGAELKDQEDIDKAKKNLDAEIQARDEAIKDDQQTLVNDQDAINFAKAAKDVQTSGKAVTESYGQLIDAQKTMYTSIYRAREIRLTLQCSISTPPPPPPPPQP